MKSGKMIRTIYFAGGCFWGMERLFQCIDGVEETECGYANGNAEIVPDYKRVCEGDTGYRETVKVEYDPELVSLRQLLTAFFYVIDPTVEKRQGPDVGDQYQTGIYYETEEDGKTIMEFVEGEKEKYPVFAVEMRGLSVFVPAEEYHQDYLIKNPQGYCHIAPGNFAKINEVVKKAGTKDRREQNIKKAQEQAETAEKEKRDPGTQAVYKKPEDRVLKEKLSQVQYEVTQHAATEYAFTGEYWDHFEKGIYVDITTGQPLFSSRDKYKSSCGWPGFCAPIEKKSMVYIQDHSFGMERTEVRSEAGNAHLGHVFYGEPESPNGIRYCINSASLRFVPYEKMEEEGYGELMKLFDEPQ